jgi:hypothetical protein
LRKNKPGIIGLAAVFLLLGAAVGLHLNSVALTNHANFRTDIFFSGMRGGMASYYGDDDSFRNYVQSFTAKTAGEKNLIYNFIVLKPNGDVQYKLNNNFLPGDKAIFVSDGVAASLTDKATGKEQVLATSSGVVNSNGNENNVGSAEDVAAAKQKFLNYINSGQANIDKSVARADITISATEDSGPSYYTFWIYHDDASQYHKAAHTQGTLALAVLSAYWLLLALWVLLDARRRQRNPWMWAGLTLAANLAGLLVYLIARSQGVGKSGREAPGGASSQKRRACGLVLLFSALALSIMCLGAYLLIPREEFPGQQKALASVMKRDEVTFLSKGFYLDTVDPDNIPQELFNMQPYGSDTEYASENKILLRVYADGIIAGQDSAEWLNFTENRMYLKWWGKNVYLVCNNYPELTKKFAVSTYNINNLDGDAEAVGTIGTPFQDSPGTQAEFNALHLESEGYMRIYKPTGGYNLTGKAQYLVEMASVPQLQPTVLAYHQDWKLRASQLLGITSLLLFALYWLLLPLWVYFDARRQSRSGGWAAAVLLTNAAGLLAYLAVSARQDRRSATLPCPPNPPSEDVKEEPADETEPAEMHSAKPLEDEPQNPGDPACGESGLPASGPTADNEAEPSLPLMLRGNDSTMAQENHENR